MKINIIVGVMLLISSCTGVKYLEDGQKFYDGAEIKFNRDSLVRNPNRLKEQLRKVIEPVPNSKFLGMRPSVWFYNIAGEPKKNKGLKYWLKYKLGKAPVLISQVKADRINKRIQSLATNKGYFHTEVSHEVKERKNSGSIVYKVKTGKPYLIGKIEYPEADSAYQQLIDQTFSETLIKAGRPYDLDLLKTEQQRIEDFLENRGFYYFDDNYLIYEADSSVGNHKVDLKLILSDKTPLPAKQQFKISDILVYPNYSLKYDSSEINASADSVINPKGSIRFINDDGYIRQEIVKDLIVLKPDSIYSQEANNLTLNHFFSQGPYKYVDIKFRQSDSATLISEIFLTPLPKKSIRLELQALSKSNNFVGPAFSISFLNRNAFRGAELLDIKLNTSYDIQVGGRNNPPLNAFELNLESSLTIPRLISPFNIDFTTNQFFPNTRMSVGVRIRERLSLFRLTSFETKYGFTWQQSRKQRHELFPINISFVQLSKVSTDFKRQLELDPALNRSIDNQFILGGTYDYIYNTKNLDNASEKPHNFYFNPSLDISGNLAYLGESVILRGDEGGSNVPKYAQYIKTSFDFRHYWRLDKNNELVSRVFLGLGRAYGNSSELPFIKQFSSGGANSVRAFRARSLGPGAFTGRAESELETDNGFIIDETGDIKIEANFEYRSNIVGVLDGALFVDAGNIWLWRNEDIREGGQFSSNFLSELALGTGAGLRLDFSFFILRFDLAFPLRKPNFPSGERWVTEEIKFLDKSWRRDNLILNIAIGYPF